MAKTDQLKKLPFEGKVAVLAGATDGIGYAIADRLAHDGAKVMISSRKQVNVDKAVESLQKQHGTESVSGIICHVGKDEDRKRLIKESIKQFGRIDILVDNAGVNPSYGKCLKTTEEQWARSIFEINVSAAALLVQEAYPYLKKNGYGKMKTALKQILDSVWIKVSGLPILR
ncbi:dehydrogenase/reductase SDR family member 4-like [Gigantopelta aegis]|uniref:dehydrogenase/reductase SDR family member 4-like n=1 Tax=Gigantopelta aegis TaxID=1735272 RepID=UPI001B8898FA|nr:dehydrogenase/reductase SDR family member 4-like [Gigantopelta aegis]